MLNARRASGDSVARIGGSLGRPRAARASGAGCDRRRRSDLSRAHMTGGEAHARRRDRPADARSEGRPRAAQWHAGNAGVARARSARAEIAADTADVAAALSLDALRGSPAAFDPRIAERRPFAGHATTARNLERLNRGSEIRESHRSPEKDPRVQDPYSLRCAPQVHGAVRDALAQIRATVAIELNSATDNPLVFADSGEVISGGNFHGQPLAMAADQLAVALATLGGISERRIEQMTNPQTSQLPAFLVRERGTQFRVHDSASYRRGARQAKPRRWPHRTPSIRFPRRQIRKITSRWAWAAARRLQPMLGEPAAHPRRSNFWRHARASIFSRRCERAGKRSAATISSVPSPNGVDADRSLAPDIEAVAQAIAKGSFSQLLR